MVEVAAGLMAAETSGRLGILFLCVHNAGRSQMAAGFAKHLGGDRVSIFSAGSEPAQEVNPSAVAVMSEIGIDIASNTPQLLTEDILTEVDVVVTMGCGDTCPYIEGKTYRDWELDDPRGQAVGRVRQIRDEIERLVASLIEEMAT